MEPERTTYLGGHDVGAIVGVHPWLSAVEVRAIKRGELPAPEQTERMRWGLLLEDAIVEGFGEAKPEYRIRRTGFLAHPTYPFIGGHPDRLLFHDIEGKGLLSCKATMGGNGWGEPGTDQVPPYVVVQEQWYLGLAKARYSYVARLLGTRGLDLYRLDFDKALFDALVVAAVEFWQRKVVDGEFVEPDGSEAYRDELRRRFPKDDGLELIATPEQQLLADEYGAATNDERRAKERVERLRQRIETAMGEATSLVGPGFRLTWKVEAGRPAWKDIALAAGATPEVIAEHTPEGARVFRAHFEKREEAAA